MFLTHFSIALLRDNNDNVEEIKLKIITKKLIQYESIKKSYPVRHVESRALGQIQFENNSILSK